MASQLLKKAEPSVNQLDAMIFKLETQLGKAHVASPFSAVYQKYGVEMAKNVKEEKKEEVKQEKKQDKPKKEKKPKQAAPAKGAAAASDLEEWAQWYKACDLRVAKIVECEKHPDSDKLYIEKIDVGEGELRTIGSGLQPYCTMEDMLSGLCVVFANLKPKKLGGVPSNGMVMCASSADHSQCEILRPAEGSKIGERVQLVGNPIEGQELSNEPTALLNPKKKIQEKFSEFIKTDGECKATYNGIRLTTSAGPLSVPTLKDCFIS